MHAVREPPAASHVDAPYTARLMGAYFSCVAAYEAINVVRLMLPGSRGASNAMELASALLIGGGALLTGMQLFRGKRSGAVAAFVACAMATVWDVRHGGISIVTTLMLAGVLLLGAAWRRLS